MDPGLLDSLDLYLDLDTTSSKPVESTRGLITSHRDLDGVLCGVPAADKWMIFAIEVSYLIRTKAVCTVHI